MKPGFALAAAVAAAALVASCSGQERPAVRGAAQAPTQTGGAVPTGMAMGALQQGRFNAAAAFQASILAQNPEDRQAQLGYALAQLGMGQTDEAVARLRALVADGGEADADVGLALALAGEAREGVAVLERAAVRPDANIRTRQNLALALALADSWPRARALVEQEVGPQQATWRLTQWAAWAALPPPHRLAGFLGVPPGSAAPVELAQEAIPPLPGASLDSQPVMVAAAEASAAAEEPVEQPVEAVAAQPVEPADAAVAVAAVAALAQAEPAMPAGRGEAQAQPQARWVIQLAAFRHTSPETGWQRLQRRYPSLLSGFAPQLLQGSGAGTWHRLAIGGFAARQEAVNQCRALRDRGIDCFARPASPDAKPLGAANG